jgi:hypothetical protein
MIFPARVGAASCLASVILCRYRQSLFLAITSGLNPRTASTAAFVRETDVSSRVALSPQQISNRGNT